VPDASPPSPPKLRSMRARDLLFLIPVAIGFAFFAAPELWSPWVYFTGGSFHAMPWWSGAGSFTGPDGSYQLYLSLSPMNTGSTPYRLTPLQGDGHLCTPAGERLILHISGDMDKHLPMDTLGRTIEISSFPRSKPGSFSAMQAAGKPYVHLNGVWGPGRIDAKGMLEYEPADPGKPKPPQPSPIAVTLQQGGEWWPPACKKH
jgi:hypothetical protein